MSDPSSVFGLIKRRLCNESQPGQRGRKDVFHLALAVEGGGMRGAVSAGMLVALERFGALSVFDSVWGASAGAINSAYFITRQANESAGIYPERLASNRFINPRRFLRGGDFISLDYLFSLLKQDYRLNVGELLRSPIPLHPISFCLDDWATVDLGHPNSEDDLFLRLRASAQVPLFAGKPIEISGRRFFDAACGEFIPVQSALNGGATHVLALHTRALGASPTPISRIERLMYHRWLKPIDPRLIEHFESRQQLYLEQMRSIRLLGGHVFSVHPSNETAPIAATERRRALVETAFESGLAAMVRAWPATPEPARSWWETLSAWRSRLPLLRSA